MNPTETEVARLQAPINGSPRRVWIDTDGGQDDAIALLMALASPDALDVRGVSTVAGGVDVAAAARNVSGVLDMAERSGFPVPSLHEGCHRPLVRPLERYFDSDDFPGWSGPIEVDRSDDLHAVHAITASLRGAGDASATFCALGPLTNLAVALVSDRHVAASISSVVMLGGSIGGGNITEHAEFNVLTDPHAARVAVESGLPLVMIPADVCEQVRIRDADLGRLRTGRGPFAGVVCDLLENYGNEVDHDEYRRVGRPLFDPMVVAWCTRPDLFTVAPARVDVVTDETPRIGSTDVEIEPSQGANVLVVVSIDRDGFLDGLEHFLSGRQTSSGRWDR